eukprot:154858-Chlamydomonas_euryale.AAC.3
MDTGVWAACFLRARTPVPAGTLHIYVCALTGCDPHVNTSSCELPKVVPNCWHNAHSDSTTTDKRAALGDYDSPIMVACEGGHSKVAEFLLGTPGVDINSSSTRKSPLHVALAKRHWDIAWLLLQHGSLVRQETVDMARRMLPDSSDLLTILVQSCCLDDYMDKVKLERRYGMSTESHPKERQHLAKNISSRQGELLIVPPALEVVVEEVDVNDGLHNSGAPYCNVHACTTLQADNWHGRNCYGLTPLIAFLQAGAATPNIQVGNTHQCIRACSEALSSSE